MKANVWRTLLLTTLFGTLVVMTPTKSSADTSLGQFCWTLSPFIDTIRVDVSSGAGPETAYNLHARWRVPGLYQLVGSGQATTSLTPGKIDLGIVASHGTTNFGSNQICHITATIDPSTLGGPYQARCPGPINWSFSGSLVAKTCAGTDGAEASGPAAGQ